MRLRRATAAALASLLLIAGCGPGTAAESAGAPETAESSASGHAGHGSGTEPPAAPLRAGEEFLDLAMPAAYQPAAPNGGTDEYRCFVVDPGLTENAFLTGSRFLPQNAAIVHHAIFYRLSPAQAVEAASVDAATPEQGWTCFGGAGVGGQTAWVAHWAPGAGETLLPDGFGFEMEPGSKLVMQVHYNLLGVDAAAPATDRSGIQVRVSRAPHKKLETALALAPIELPCEAGTSGPLCDRATAVADVEKRFGKESGAMVQQLSQMCRPVAGNTQHCDQPVEQAGTIYMAAGHMHLLGRSIKVEVDPGTPRARTVVDVPRYDFDNQALVPLAKPVSVAKGDVVRVTCTHDASLRTQLPQLKTLPPRYVVWGEGTSDEMCLGIMVFAPQE
ncbi:monooxygenase [Actinoplanes sp. NPDC051494]|uniref:monooxygenase n=1 Tax=Actinoplanes sp. NPDC051494 TaxID=3363907 RepID=UPI0037AB14CC